MQVQRVVEDDAEETALGLPVDVNEHVAACVELCSPSGIK